MTRVYDVVGKGLPWLETSSVPSSSILKSAGVLIGHLYVPSSSNNSGNSIRFARTGKERLYFVYDDTWLTKGFSIGADLPLRPGKHPLPMREKAFGFMRDRSLSPEAQGFIESGITAGIELDVPDDASSTERAALLYPHAFHHPGGIDFLVNAWATGIRTRLASESTQLDDLFYALHASEHDRARENERRLLASGTILSGRHSLLCVESRQSVAAAVMRRQDDPIDVPLWREVLMRLARRCGIDTVETRFRSSMGNNALIAERFDRVRDPETGLSDRPLFALSASTLNRAPKARFAADSLYAARSALSYLSLADILTREGSRPNRDLPQAWLRLVFAQLVGGRDKPTSWHFIREEYGWRLAPAHTFAILPPEYDAARPSITVDGKKPLRRPEDALPLARYFGLSPSDAKNRLADMRHILLDWEKDAEELGADRRERALLAPVFEDF